MQIFKTITLLSLLFLLFATTSMTAKSQPLSHEAFDKWGLAMSCPSVKTTRTYLYDYQAIMGIQEGKSKLKCGLINKKGQWVVPLGAWTLASANVAGYRRLITAPSSQNAVAGVVQSNEVSETYREDLVSPTGDIVTKDIPGLDIYPPLNPEGYCLAFKKGEAGALSPRGKIVVPFLPVPPTEDKTTSKMSESTMYFRTVEGEYLGDSTQEMLFDGFVVAMFAQKRTLDYTKDQPRRINSELYYKSAYYDKEGKQLLPFQMGLEVLFKELGYFFVRKRSAPSHQGYGLLDINGQALIPCDQAWLQPMRDGNKRYIYKAKCYENPVFYFYTAEVLNKELQVLLTNMVGFGLNVSFGGFPNTSPCQYAAENHMLHEVYLHL